MTVYTKNLTSGSFALTGDKNILKMSVDADTGSSFGFLGSAPSPIDQSASEELVYTAGQGVVMMANPTNGITVTIRAISGTTRIQCYYN